MSAASARSARVPRQVLVYLFRRSAGLEFLLLKRTEQWGGFWQGVSGAPEWGESDVEGAIREVLEETGFDVADRIEAVGFRYELVRDDDPDGDRWEGIYGPDVDVVPEEVFVAEVPAGAEPLLSPYEHDDSRWCSFEEALELLKWDNNRDALVARKRSSRRSRRRVALPKLSSMVIRRGGRQDVRFLRDMLHHAYYWRERQPGDGPGPAARYVKGWGRPGDTVLIAIDDGFPVGAAWYRLFRRDAPGYGFVDEQTPELAIAVVPSRRGRGIGESLLEALCERARADGYGALSLSVERENPALVAFYEEHGFTVVEDGDADSVTMRRELSASGASAAAGPSDRP